MTKSFTLDKPKRSEGWAKFQEWNRKWNRILATIFCILCFILLFAIVIVNIIETKEIHMEKSSSTTAVQALNDYYDDVTIPTTTIPIVEENYNVKIRTFSYQTTSDAGCTITNCSIACKNSVLDLLNSDIVNAVQSEPNFDCRTISLELTNYRSANTKLYKDWYTLEYSVASLIIYSSHFETIDDYAFNSGQFQQTKFFKLTDLLSLKNLTVHAFAGLEHVKILHLETFSAINDIEMGVLYPMQNTIGSILFQSMPFNILIENVTGSPYLSSEIVDLQYNSFGDRITKNSFAGLKSVVSLYLSGSKITSLPAGVFDKLTKLQLVHLNDNWLQTIPSTIFDVVVPLQVYLSENDLDCSCNEGILSLQNFFIKYPNTTHDNIMCASPDEVSNRLLFEVEIFCPPITATSASGTTDYSFNQTKSLPETTTTAYGPETNESVSTTVKPMLTTQPINDIYSNCENHTYVATANYVAPITVVGRSAEFKIIKDSNYDIFIEFVEVYYADVTLLWFTNYTQADSAELAEEALEQTNYEGTIVYRCADHVKARVKIDNLRENTVYIFCIVDEKDGRVWPFNCASFRLICDWPAIEVQDSYKNDETWLYKSEKIMVIAIISVSMLLAVISGALIMYCCLRRFPFFIAKKQRKSSRPWISEQDEIIEYHAPPNYITPTPARRSTKIEPDRSRSTLNNRRFSETSAGSARSYVSAVTPSPFDIISFRMNNSNKQKIRMSTNKPEATYDEARDNILYMEKIPDVPPPLPPHPNRRSNQSNLSSNQSTNSSTSSDPLCSISYRVQHDPDQCRTNSYA